MPAEIRVPQMGESVTEATILRWLKKEGDTVAAGDPVAELETDKVNVEVPADAAGVIQSLVHAEGDTVAVGDVLVIMAGAAGAAPDPAGSTAVPVPAVVGTAERNGGAAPTPSTAAPSASPLARTVAEDNQVDLSLVKGSGPAGRIVKDDVANFIERSSDAPATATVLAAQTQAAERAAPPPTAPQTPAHPCGNLHRRQWPPRRARPHDPPPPDHRHAAGRNSAHGGDADHVQRAGHERRDGDPRQAQGHL